MGRSTRSIGDIQAKSEYTTGEISILLGVTIGTVIRWVERGKLAGYRVTGRQQDRRIPAAALRDFCLANGRAVPRILGFLSQASSKASREE